MKRAGLAVETDVQEENALKGQIAQKTLSETLWY